MIEKRAVCMVSNPFVWDYELFYLTYNKKTNKIEHNGKELDDNSYNLDDMIIMWDGVEHDYYTAHPKCYINVYKSNRDKPEEGYDFIGIGGEDCGDLKYYHQRKESCNMDKYIPFEQAVLLGIIEPKEVGICLQCKNIKPTDKHWFTFNSKVVSFAYRKASVFWYKLKNEEEWHIGDAIDKYGHSKEELDVDKEYSVKFFIKEE